MASSATVTLKNISGTFSLNHIALGCRVSKDGSLVVWVNMDDHLRLVSTRDDGNIVEAFKCVCINLQKVSEVSPSQEAVIG